MKAFKTSLKSWLTGVLTLALLAPVALTLQSCTDLDEETFGVVTPDNFFQTPEEVLAGLAPVYAQLRAFHWSFWNISQHTSDETLVPTRGTDWDDSGRWRALHQHTWNPGDPVAEQDFNGAWVDAFTGVARANTVLANVEASSADIDKAGISAELRLLRAYYYYILLDFFGRVPIVTDPAVDEDNPPGNNTRAEVFNFVLTEVNEIRGSLPTKWDANNFGRVDQGVADALLTRLYLNAEVFGGSVTAGGLQRGPAMWDRVVEAADRVLNSGNYSLAGDYFQNFRVNNHTSPEIIFATTFLAKGGLGLNFQMRTLHYNQIPQTPWNGFSTLAETFNSFDPVDKRTKFFLVGQMYAQPNEGCLGSECFSDTSSPPLTDRNGRPLIFTPEFFDPLGNRVTGNPINVDEASGVRVLKWEIDPARTGGDMGDDQPIFRLSEIYLSKAEALNELGRTAEAVDLVNAVRARSFDPPKPLNAGDFTQASFREQILQERKFELFWEATRRQDLIRHNKFNDAWEFKNASQPFKAVFPIPQIQLDANPSLSQNPGY